MEKKLSAKEIATQYENELKCPAYEALQFNDTTEPDQRNRIRTYAWDYLIENIIDLRYYTLDIKLVQNSIEIINLLRKHATIMGGSIGSILHSRHSHQPHIHDLDLFLDSPETLEKLKPLLEKINHRVTYTQNAITIKKENDDGQRVQIICRRFGKPDEIVKTFDLTCSMSWFNLATSEIHIHPHTKNKTIEYNLDCKTPFTTPMRVIKYVQRGYNISVQEMMDVQLAVMNIKEIESSYEAMLATNAYYVPELDAEAYTVASFEPDINEQLKMDIIEHAFNHTKSIPLDTIQRWKNDDFTRKELNDVKR